MGPEHEQPVWGGEPVLAVAVVLAVILAGVGIAVDADTLVVIFNAVFPLVAAIIQRSRVTPVK